MRRSPLLWVRLRSAEPCNAKQSRKLGYQNEWLVPIHLATRSSAAAVPGAVFPNAVDPDVPRFKEGGTAMTDFILVIVTLLGGAPAAAPNASALLVPVTNAVPAQRAETPTVTMRRAFRSAEDCEAAAAAATLPAGKRAVCLPCGSSELVESAY